MKFVIAEKGELRYLLYITILLVGVIIGFVLGVWRMGGILEKFLIDAFEYSKDTAREAMLSIIRKYQ